jgi:hypothetical protein
MGEPRPVLSEDARERVVAALRAGSDEARAIRFAKVDPALYYSWLERGEADLERGAFTEQAQFARDVQQAKSESAVTAMAAVRAAMREWNLLVLPRIAMLGSFNRPRGRSSARVGARIERRPYVRGRSAQPGSAAITERIRNSGRGLSLRRRRIWPRSANMWRGSRRSRHAWTAAFAGRRS